MSGAALLASLGDEWPRLLADAVAGGWLLTVRTWDYPTRAELVVEDPHGPFPLIRLYWRDTPGGEWAFRSGGLYTPGLHPLHPNHVTLGCVAQVAAVLDGYDRAAIPGPAAVGPYLGFMERLIEADR